MASTTSGGGLLANVQRQLAQGRSDEEILADLTAGGLSRASAMRFLERARPAGARPAGPLPTGPVARGTVPASLVPPPIPTVPPVPSLELPPPIPGEVPPVVTAPAAAAPIETAEPKGSWVGVVGGAVVLTIGLMMLAWALSQERNVRIRLPLAIVITGAGWMLHAARESIDRRRPATWVLPGVSAVPPVLACLAVLGTFVATRDREPANAEAATPAQEAQVRPRRVVAAPSREDAVARNVDTVEGRRRGDLCFAASELARLEAREHVTTLEDALSTAKADMNRICLAYSLVRLGEHDAMLAQYLEWSQAENGSLRHAAVVGFGHIGPSAAPDALPVLEHILASGATAAQRYTVAETLGKLGPSARPMLQPLTTDEDPQVRTVAQRTLERLR